MEAQLKFSIQNQIITRLDDFRPVAFSSNYLLAYFSFVTDDWDVGPLKTAIFTDRNGKSYKVIINDGLCTVPWEILQTTGYVKVSVYAGDRITTNCASFFVEQSGYTEDAENEKDPTPGIYDQIMNEINYIKAGNLDGGLFTDWDAEVGD